MPTTKRRITAPNEKQPRKIKFLVVVYTPPFNNLKSGMSQCRGSIEYRDTFAKKVSRNCRKLRHQLLPVGCKILLNGSGRSKSRIIRPLFNRESPKPAGTSVPAQSKSIPDMTSPCASGRHLLRFENGAKCPIRRLVCVKYIAVLHNAMPNTSSNFAREGHHHNGVVSREIEIPPRYHKALRTKIVDAKYGPPTDWFVLTSKQPGAEVSVQYHHPTVCGQPNNTYIDFVVWTLCSENLDTVTQDEKWPLWVHEQINFKAPLGMKCKRIGLWKWFSLNACALQLSSCATMTRYCLK